MAHQHPGRATDVRSFPFTSLFAITRAPPSCPPFNRLLLQARVLAVASSPDGCIHALTGPNPLELHRHELRPPSLSSVPALHLPPIPFIPTSFPLCGVVTWHHNTASAVFSISLLALSSLGAPPPGEYEPDE